MQKKVTYIISNINKALAFEWIATHLDRAKFKLDFILLNPADSVLENYFHEHLVPVSRVTYRGKRDILKAIFQIRNPLLFLHPMSQTFHGRDVFAPVAAHLSKGLPLQKLGPRVRDFVRLDWPKPKISEGVMVGKIIYLDGFGNAITNISGLSLREFGSERCQVSVKRKPICRIGSFYQAVPIGKPVAVPGSSGFLEIAVNCGSAAKVFRLKVGDTVTVRWKSRQ